MTFFDAENIRRVCHGEWISAPKNTFTVTGVGTDTRENLTNKAFIALKGDRHDAHDHLDDAVQAGAALLIIDKPLAASQSPSTSIPILHVKNTRAALRDLATAYRATLNNTKVIAVTGSCGKTTTKELIHFALASSLQGTRAPKSFNNDIGVPLTILAASPGDQYLILELGMNHPGEIAALAKIAQPDIAVITTIGPAHLGGLGSVEAIAEEKRTLLDHLRPDGIALLNTDHAFAAVHALRHKDAILFGESAQAHYRLTCHGRDETQNLWWFDINNQQRYRLALPGRHNAVNALAAIAVAEHLGLKPECISAGLANASLPAMRLTCHDIDGITLYNDAHNANPQSMHASIRAFLDISAGAPRRVLILGDMFELGPAAVDLHRAFAHELLIHDDAPEFDHVILIGELMKCAADVLSSQWSSNRINWHRALDEGAIHSIWDTLREGDFVLLKASRGMALERILTERPRTVLQSAHAVA